MSTVVEFLWSRIKLICDGIYTATSNRVEQGECREFLWWKKGYPKIIAVFPFNKENPVVIAG